MDIGKAFGFVFEDEEWVSKLLLGTVILLIPIFGTFVLIGYTIALTRNVKAGEPRPLPAWQDLGRYFMDGLMFWVATLLYTLPFLIFICPITIVGLLPVLAGEQEELMTILAGVSGIMMLGLGCLAALYGILLTLLTPVVQIRYAESGEIGACLRFGDVFRFLFANIGPIIISQVLMWVAGMVVGTVVSVVVSIVSLIPFCGWILAPALGLLMLPFATWLMLFSAHLYGQIAQRASMAPVMV